MEGNQIRYILHCNFKEATKTIKGMEIVDLKWKEQDFKRVTGLFEKEVPQLENLVSKAEKIFCSVLVVCSNGQNRSLCLMICFLMRRFCWSLFKCLEFMHYKKRDLEIRSKVYDELEKVCLRFEGQNKVSHGWT